MRRVWFFILLTFSSACNVSTKRNIFDKIDAFVFIREEAILKKSDDGDVRVVHNASGVCIAGFDNKTVLTAGHVCELDVIKKIGKLQSDITIETTLYDGEVSTATVIRFVNNEYQDLCLLRMQSAKCIDTVRLSENAPEKGDDVITFAAPRGVFLPTNVIFFDGHYIGTNENNYMIFALPATQGSSGSPVLNSDLQLISIVDSVIEDFMFISTGTNFDRLKRFVNE